MRKLICIFLIAFVPCHWDLIAQDPFMVPTEGLGQYGYLELEATTYARLSSNTYEIRGLAARWWTGSEYWYYSDPGSGLCELLISNTEDYSSSNHTAWNAGTIAYVAVRFRECFFDWNPTNYNERSFQLIDVDNTYSGTFEDFITDDPTGDENLVGSFIISAGGTELTLGRLWITNIGTAQEGADIPNDGIRVYYEPVTGSETYDGTETFRTLYGDYAGNDTSNEEWGHDDLNLPVGAAGVRCYIVVNDVSSTNTAGLTVQFQIQNDGISFEEVRDGSYNMLRINALATAPVAIPLPVELLAFLVKLKDGLMNLYWKTAFEFNNDRFEIEHSEDGIRWSLLGTIWSKNELTKEKLSYSFVDENPFKGMNYYRLKQIDIDGTIEYSNIISVENSPDFGIQIYPNPVSQAIYIELDDTSSGVTQIILSNLTGQVLFAKQAAKGMLVHTIDTSAIPSGHYYIEIIQNGSLVHKQKIAKQ